MDSTITIGITCYNEGDWLLECWESVLAQTDDLWEAVLVMDGTEHQRTREIFEQLDHPKLRKFAFEENVGPFVVRNKAFEMTRTPYHFYLDGDDQLLPDTVAVVLAAFEEHPDAASVNGDMVFFGEREGVFVTPAQYTAEILVDHHYGVAGAHRKDAWEAVGGFADEPILSRGISDYDFLIGLVERGLRIVHCGKPFYRYRIRFEGSVSTSDHATRHLMYHAIVARHPEFFRERGRRRRFLLRGYQRCCPALKKVDPGVASAVAFYGIRKGIWGSRMLWYLAFKGILPGWLFVPGRACYRMGLKVFGSLHRPDAKAQSAAAATEESQPSSP